MGSAEFTIGGQVNVVLLNFSQGMADIGIGQSVRAGYAVLLSSHRTTRVGSAISTLVAYLASAKDGGATRLL